MGSRQLVLDTARALWPTAHRVDLTRSPLPRPGEDHYLVLPRLDAPRWLLPARSPGAATALRGRRLGGVRGLAADVLATAHRAGLTRLAPLARLRVPSGGRGSLVTAVQDRLGPEQSVALRLGSWTHPRSVVLQVCDPCGSVTAFGKVGLDPRGEESVRAERARLRRASELGLRLVTHPQVMDTVTWHGHEVLLVTPLDARSADGRDPGLPVEAMLELAAAGARSDRLAGSGWWTTTRRRLAQVADPAVRADLSSALERLGRLPLSLPLGTWHGDWTPWNMSREDATIRLWDWEHGADDVPVGFDLVHYLAQQLRVEVGTDAEAEDTWRRLAVDALGEHVGLDTASAGAVLAAYLVEVNLRFVLDRQGTPLASSPRAGWGLELLRREAARLEPPTEHGHTQKW